jgi:hypothetical protein
METITPPEGELNKSKAVLSPRLKYRGRAQQWLALFLTGSGLTVATSQNAGQFAFALICSSYGVAQTCDRGWLWPLTQFG